MSRRKETQRDRVRKWLETNGTITNVEAVQQGIFRLSERCRELQAEGMEITGDFVRVDGKKTGTYRYTLAGGPKPPPPKIEVVMGPNGPVARMVQ